MLTVGSLFSGIAGFDEAFRREGFDVRWMCEIEPFPRKVLAKRFPEVVCHEDVRTVTAATAERVDVLVGGFPCQDLSVAGKRAGLSGERSGLFFEFMRVADELKPTWVVVENVPGLLSSHRGADFTVVVNTLVELGYGVAWRVLDSQHFGVAQRRRRVFLVACAGGQHDRAAAVLFEREGGQRDSATGEEAGAGLAACLRGRSARSGGNPPAIAGSYRMTAFGEYQDDGTASAIKQRDYKDATDLIAFDTTQVTSAQNYSNPQPGDPCHPLAAGAHPLAITFTQNQRDELRELDVAGALSSEPGTHQTTYLAHTITANYGKQIDSSDTNQGPPNLIIPAVAATIKSHQTGGYPTTDVEMTIIPVEPITMEIRGRKDGRNLEMRQDGLANALRTPNGGRDGLGVGAVATIADTLSVGANQTTGRPGDISPEPSMSGGVRRLTPTECERLQAFPDGWTCLCGCEPYSTANCECPDSPRYRALGNAVTVTVIQWIARRLKAAHEAIA